MITEVLQWWAYLSAARATLQRRDEKGTAVETVIITALFAALAIAVLAIIATKVKAKANSLDLNN